MIFRNSNWFSTNPLILNDTNLKLDLAYLTYNLLEETNSISSSLAIAFPLSNK